MSGEGSPEGSGLALATRIRLAALLGLVAAAVVFPADAHSRPAEELPALALVYGLHVLIVTTALVSTYVGTAEPLLDRLMVVLAVAYIGTALAYLHLWPAYAMLVAEGMATILMVSAAFFLWPARRIATMSALACVGFAGVGWSATRGDTQGIPFALALGAVVVGAAVAIASARALDRYRESLAERQRELAALTSRLMSAQEEERRRISRELHDELGQSLTALSAHLWLVVRGLPEEAPLRAQTAEARRLLARTLAAMRELSHLLRPSVLDEFGLVLSLDSHLRTFAERHGIATSFQTSGLPERLPPETETALYRITQEALTNVVRHAHAQQVRVEMLAANGELRLAIEDDGVGVAVTEGRDPRGGTGLVGIRERVRALGGTVAVHSGRGVRLDIRLPLPAV
jgi:two-component system sensor histidine kinase UhpB